MRHPILLCLLLSTGQVGAQVDVVRFNLMLHKANVLMARGDTLNALPLYDSAFAHVPWGLWELSEAASSAYLVGDTTRGTHYLQMLYARGGQPLISYSELLKGIVAHGFVEPTLSRLLIAQDQWAEQADSIWITALTEMHALDQSDRDDSLSRERNDRINLERLISMSEERGFPTPAKVGSSFGTVHLLMWHHRGELGNNQRIRRFVELVQEAMENGTVPPDLLIMYRDYEDLEAGRPMRYGALINVIREPGPTQFVPREELNRNRDSVGVETIEEFTEILGLDLDAILGK